MSTLLPNLRADFAVSETYRYTDRTPLRCALTAFGGTDDHIATEVTIEEWEEVTSGRFRAHVFDGGHFYWLDDPAPLVQEIGTDLVDSFPELR
jgi:medium-chain acyl-[acyl-carrier-protein] hydrolase